MDLGDTKGEHGGIHEAAIGLGNFAGPAVGAASLYFLPQYANSGALAVSGLLLLGLGGLLAIWRKGTYRGAKFPCQKPNYGLLVSPPSLRFSALTIYRI